MPLSVEEFVKKSSIIQFTPEALRNDAHAVTQIATHEGLWAHAESVALRCELLLGQSADSMPIDGGAGAQGGVTCGE